MDHDVDGAIRRLLAIAETDTGQALRVANFLLAWWNGDDLGHFRIHDLWNVDEAISSDMLLILTYLARQPSAVYADAFGFDADMRALVQARRPEVIDA